MRGRVLLGPHPGVLSNAQRAGNIKLLLSEGLSTFVCLQEELQQIHKASGVVSLEGGAGLTTSQRSRRAGYRYFQNDAFSN